MLVYLLSTYVATSDWSFILQNKQNVDIGLNPYNDLGRILEEINMWLYNYASAYIYIATGLTKTFTGKLISRIR